MVFEESEAFLELTTLHQGAAERRVMKGGREVFHKNLTA